VSRLCLVDQLSANDDRTRIAGRPTAVAATATVYNLCTELAAAARTEVLTVCKASFVIGYQYCAV